MKHEDQIKREKIPVRADLPTKFHPCQDLLMVVPIPDISQVGTIILPESARIVLNEGHIVEKGPLCSERFNVGDCITWDTNSEYRLTVDNVPFILVRESCITMRIPKQELLDAIVDETPPLPFQQAGTEGEWNCLRCGHRCGPNEVNCPKCTLPKEGGIEIRGEGIPVYRCPACGSESLVDYADIEHAVNCPEHPSGQQAS